MYYEVSEITIDRIKKNIEENNSKANIGEKYLAKNKQGDYIALNCGLVIVSSGVFKKKDDAVRFLEENE
jgi:hypothetical protein